MNIERASKGQLELRLSDDPEEFRRIAEMVRSILGGKWIEQLEHLDQSYWDLDVNGKKITVHREHFLGVSVFSAENDDTRGILEQLRRKFAVSAGT